MSCLIQNMNLDHRDLVESYLDELKLKRDSGLAQDVAGHASPQQDDPGLHEKTLAFMKGRGCAHEGGNSCHCNNTHGEYELCYGVFKRRVLEAITASGE